jgi:anhydro-N-acetylmuramic acid kinase
MAKMVSLGLMSGSSLDGLDVALVEFEEVGEVWDWKLIDASTEPYSLAWQERLAQAPSLSGEELYKLDNDYGHYLGMTARRWLLERDKTADLVASHGHTIFHQPQRQFTVQIGHGEAMVTHLNVPVVTQFRDRDIALGGEGAPLVPMGELHLFPQLKLFLNLGGIANLSVFGLAQLPVGTTWLRHVPQQLGFDVCACNQVINHLATRAGQTYDDGGAMAKSGSLEPRLLEMLEGLDFYRLAPPRSLANEYIRNIVLPLFDDCTPQDALHTVVEHIVNQILISLKRLERNNEKLLVTGGGAHNTYLISRLSETLASLGIEVELPEKTIIDYKEAIIFAFLGVLRMLGQPNTLPDVTGARSAASGGSLHLPTSYAIKRV